MPMDEQKGTGILSYAFVPHVGFERVLLASSCKLVVFSYFYVFSLYSVLTSQCMN